MGLINAKPRFGYDPEDNTIYDYVLSKHFPAVGIYEGPDGDWDCALLVEAIKSGQPVEPLLDRVAHTADSSPPPPSAPAEEIPVPQPVDKVEQANKDFDAETPPNVPDKVDAAQAQFAAEPDEVKTQQAAEVTEAKVADGAHE